MSGQLELMPGETMIVHSHPHWWYFWKHALGAGGVVVLLVLALWANGGVAKFLGWITALAFVGWACAVAYQYMQWRTTNFAVTDQRVAYQSGLFRRRGVSIPLDRVNNVNFEQGLIARMLGNGTLTIESAGETGDSVFQNIPEPSKVRATIFDQMRGQGASASERDAAALAKAMKDAQPTPPAAAATAEQRLTELEHLKATGMINDEEYAQKRAQILGEL